MDVFVYGTLTNPDRVREVVDSFVFVGPAVLEGLRVVDGEYPTLVPVGDGAVRDRGSEMTDSAVAGRLLRTDEIDALDAYERVDDGLYVRVSVPVVDDARSANSGEGESVDATGGEQSADGDEVAVYVGDPERLGATAGWPGDGPFPERVRAGLDDRQIRVRIR